MVKFDEKEFGERLKKFRKEKGLSQENLAHAINKSNSTIARFESGEIIPNAEDIFLLCKELEIDEYELFKSSNKPISEKESVNPFNTNTLYIYYNGYYHSTNKYNKCKFKINIYNKQNYCALEFVDYKTDKIYMTGYIESDNYMAFFRFNNYKINSPRLECTQIDVNISNGTENLMKAALFCTNDKYEPCCRKCYISEKDLEFSDEMLNELKINDIEIEKMKELNIWYMNIESKEDFEN